MRFPWSQNKAQAFNTKALLLLTRTLVRIEVKLSAIGKTQEKMMSEIDDMNAALAKLTTAVNAGIAEIKLEATNIQTLLASSNDTQAMEAAATQISALADQLTSAIAAAQPAPAAPAAAASSAPAAASAPASAPAAAASAPAAPAS